MDLYSNFEWYYFDLHNPDDYDLVCTIHPKPFNSVFDIVIFDIFIYREKKCLLHHFFTLPAKNINETKKPYILFYDDNNYLKKTDNIYQIKLKDEKLDLEFSLTDLLKNNKPATIELLPETCKNQNFKWIVYAPFCLGEAAIRWDKNNLFLSGKGYHDYNSGSVNLKRKLKYWYWGKYFFNDNLLVYGYIIASNGEIRRIAVLIKDKNLFIDDNPQFSKKDDILSFTVNNKSYSFKMQDAEVLDNISFYMSSFSMKLKMLVKVLEVVFFVSSKSMLMIPVRKLFGNVSYKRSINYGLMTDGTTVSCFFEEMKF